MQRNFPVVEQALWLIFQHRYHARPTRMRKLLIEQVLLKPPGVANQHLQQFLHGGLAVENALVEITVNQPEQQGVNFFIEISLADRFPGFA